MMIYRENLTYITILDRFRQIFRFHYFFLVFVHVKGKI